MSSRDVVIGAVGRRLALVASVSASSTGGVTDVARSTTQTQEGVRDIQA